MTLNGLPRGAVGTADEPCSPPPIPNSYWLPGAWVAAGEFPGALGENDARAKIGALLDAGIRTFVDLTTEDDFLAPYDAVLRAEAADRRVIVSRQPMPIPDMDVTTPDAMRRILNLLDAERAAGRAVYVHCWGGVGRTGLVVGCHLVRRGAAGDEALDTVRRLFATMSEDKVRRHRGQSPQTPAQVAMVRGWAAHEAGRNEASA